jgi:CheY-like chemotaxis protein
MTLVLVADAEELILRLLQHALGNLGYEVVSARNGMVALELVERLRPAVAVLDTELPGVDGRHAARLIAQSAHAPRTRVVLLAASADQVGNRSHVDAVLQKPFRLEELAERIRALCAE